MDKTAQPIAELTEPTIFKDIQKRTRIMSQEMLDKLAEARIKAIARKKELAQGGNEMKIAYLQEKMNKIKMIKEAKVVVPIETTKKKRTSKKVVVNEVTLAVQELKQELKPTEVEEEEEEEEIHEPPPIVRQKPKKKIIIEESKSEEEDEATEIVYVRKPKISIRPRVPFKQEQPIELPTMIQPMGFGRRF